MRYCFLALICLSSVAAIGLAQDYHVNNTLFIEQGTSYQHKITIQNSEDTPVSVNFFVHGDFASVQGKENVTLILSPKSYTNAVYITINIPRNISAGTKFTGTFGIQPDVNATGPVVMTVRITDSYTVIVTGNYRKQPPILLYSCIALAALIILSVVSRKLWKRFRLWLTKPPKNSYVYKKRFATNQQELLNLVNSMSDEDLKIESERIASWVYKKTKNPELYHQLKIAKTTEKMRRVLQAWK